MSFWIKVDVAESGIVTVRTYDTYPSGGPCNPLRERTGATVSQALRALAAAMVYAKAETVGAEK